MSPALYRFLRIAALTALPVSLAFASYDAPVSSLQSDRAFDPEREFKSVYGSHGPADPSEPSLVASAHQIALNDSDNRIGEDFQIRGPMRDLVSLWLRVYTEYTTEQTVLFDRKHPEVIYEVLDFKDLKRKSRNNIAYEIVKGRQTKRRYVEYHAAFAHLAKLAKKKKDLSPDSPGLNPTERRILVTIVRAEHPHKMSEWNAGLRGQVGQRDNVVKGLLSAETFFPKMEEIFEQLDLPQELTRLPLVESSFNIVAHSKAGAKGVWQFMPGPGKEFMKVDEAHGIDERLSPLKSTIGAARLLKRNLIIGGNWPLAITAYNHGYRGISKLTPKERAAAIDGSLFKLCQPKKKKTLGYASSNYYAEFLALLHAEAYKDLFYGDTPLPVAPALTFHRVNASLTGVEYARRNGIPLQDFRLFNPDVVSVNSRLPVGYYLILPGNDGEIDDLITAMTQRTSRTRRVAKNGRAKGSVARRK